MVWNRYKTFNVYGRIELDLKQHAPVLFDIVRKWARMNPTNFLIFSSNGHQISSPQVSKYNELLWGKHVSTNIYRHSYLSKYYSGKTPSLDEINRLSKFMGHSIMTALKYVKLDAPI